MTFRSPLWLALLLIVAVPFTCPAPLVYTPGEGWTYEPVGGEGKWKQTRAKDQLEVAQAAFDKQAYNLALKAARRVVKVWPLSDYAPQGQYLVARSYEEKKNYERAFKEYQKIVEKYPKIPNYQEIIQRQFDISTLYLNGKWFKLWNLIPLFPSMDRTASMFEKVVRSGPYSEIAPQAQMNIGKAREKQKNYPLAVKAYETAADRYHDRPQVAAEALYRAGLAYEKQAQTAEYDQGTAGQAIATFTDFMTLYPSEPRVTEAEQKIRTLRSEQARGNFQIARFYEKRKRWQGALVYYNEVLLKDPESSYGAIARERIEQLSAKIKGTEPAAPK
jgi:outer membrane assembly lipoprotein YfiO